MLNLSKLKRFDTLTKHYKVVKQLKSFMLGIQNLVHMSNFVLSFLIPFDSKCSLIVWNLIKYWSFLLCFWLQGYTRSTQD